MLRGSFNFTVSLIEQFYQHFTGHELGDRSDTNDRIKLWTNIIARSGVTETTKHALIAVDHHQRHACGAATHKRYARHNDQRYQRQKPDRQSAEPPGQK
ncbi:Uncharacterised protein [Salmonella enterica subsp. enterica]|uniref:Uncharacterized protein n=1 Tax=Salmonella enterica I TaxID=59201 RepID=A0A447U953_SALET|nr:Uncharacterised protein [Salmonella enterica subsp. enterica]